MLIMLLITEREVGLYKMRSLHRPSFLCHLNLATLANFWKLLNLSGAKIEISLFFHFSTKQENDKKIKHIMTEHRSILR